jgi:hypothetical protein
MSDSYPDKPRAITLPGSLLGLRQTRAAFALTLRLADLR